MSGAGLAPLFVAILVVAAAVGATMFAMLVWFVAGQGTAGAWRSLVVALTVAGVGLGAVAIVHLALVAVRHESTRRRERRVHEWTGAWAEVASGGRVPFVPPEARPVASEAAARVIQQLAGEGAKRVRAGLATSGVLPAELASAARGIGVPRSRSTAALERLAWIATPDALPLFACAARGPDVRSARAALLGMARVLAEQHLPDPVGRELVSAIEDHLASAPDPAGLRTFLSTVLLATGDHLSWLCARLLRRSEPEVAHVAALEAIGLSHRPEALELATEALLGATEDETAAAALRALARVGHVPENAHHAVLEATESAHLGTRVQAAHALVWLPPEVALPALWTLLGDTAWEVRRAAAQALARSGPPGEAELRRAAASHPDRFARDIAGITLAASRGASGAEEPGPPRPPARAALAAAEGAP